MANKSYSLAHTKWMCKYHIVFTPKYRRKAIYAQYRKDLQEYIRRLCKYKGVEILEGHMMVDHVHLLVAIPPMIVEAYPNKIINIHPSLIPSFCGVGFYGLKVHEAALRRGVKITGATVHFVDEGMDSGPIILQKAVEVEKGDTPEVLQRRVMEQAEWKILPKAIDMIANGEI